MFTISDNGEIELIEKPKIVREKGKSLICIPDNFTVIDLETTGLDSYYDEIIEIAAIKVRNKEIVDKFETLVNPNFPVDDFITQLTGITNEMLENAPSIEEVLPKFLDFVKDDIILGHNVNFDINFLYDSMLEILNYKFNNNYVDLLRLARKVYPNFPNHKLRTIAKELNIEFPDLHRALDDTIITYNCFMRLLKDLKNNNIDLESLFKLNKSHSKLNLKELQSNKTEFNPEHPFYKKYCVFTGKLNKMTRSDAAQKVLDVGGYCENNVTKNTNYLILGNFDYCSNIKGEKSNKLKKAEMLILKGQDLQIISENVFEELLNEL
jgi:DNA polymerase-3 subunit epsilon